jgi:hypothetical protein
LAQPLVHSFARIAFIGLPCPKKIAGIDSAIAPPRLFTHLSRKEAQKAQKEID